MRYLRLLLAAVFLLLLTLPAQAGAQSVPWRERRTLQFSVLYPQGAEAQAEQYAQFVDQVYEDASLWWGYRTPTPVILRIYPTMEQYVEANPLAATVPGVIAHAHTGRREISVALPQTVNQTPDEVVNNVRHELTHLIAADLSGGELTTLWQEGIAQNAELPAPELDRKMQIMSQVMAADRVMSWEELEEPGMAYRYPEISYPQSYTIVAFLLRRNGMPTFRAFTEAMRRAPSYRVALETTYKVSAEQLEKAWLDQLDEFVGGEYRVAPTPVFDLAPVQRQIANGQYTDAITALDTLRPSVEEADDQATLRTVDGLLAIAKRGQQAVDEGTAARSALSNGAYADAQRAALAAETLFRQLDQPEQVAVVEEYARLAQRGLDAEAQLLTAQGQIRTLQLNTARRSLNAAYGTFSELGDETRATQARLVLAAMKRGQEALAVFLSVCALLILAWNLWQRRIERRVALPYS